MTFTFPKDYHIRTASELKIDDYLVCVELKNFKKNLVNVLVDMNREKYGQKYDLMLNGRYMLARVYDNHDITKYVLYVNGYPWYIERIEDMQMVDNMFDEANSDKMYISHMLRENTYATKLMFKNPFKGISYKFICLQDIFRYILTGKRRY